MRIRDHERWLCLLKMAVCGCGVSPMCPRVEALERVQYGTGGFWIRAHRKACWPTLGRLLDRWVEFEAPLLPLQPDRHVAGSNRAPAPHHRSNSLSGSTSPSAPSGEAWGRPPPSASPPRHRGSLRARHGNDSVSRLPIADSLLDTSQPPISRRAALFDAATTIRGMPGDGAFMPAPVRVLDPHP